VPLRSVQECREAEARGEHLKFVMFWSHQPARDGRVSAACLSQWYIAPFTIDGDMYVTAEHYMMARKARLFGDDEALARILSAEHPAEAKAIGRGVRGFDGDTWEKHRFEIVVAGSVAKFRANPDMGAFLRGTGERVLVEASPLDRIWGIGLGAADERAASPAEWLGENLLGFALMEARAHLG
jgi:ribA/ribD-fused uncharacterized protein